VINYKVVRCMDSRIEGEYFTIERNTIPIMDGNKIMKFKFEKRANEHIELLESQDEEA